MIFNLFKSKPTLKELIPNGFVDIHSHILPGIDDGAKNAKESLELINEMKKMGFSKIIGTPHTYPGLYENTNKTINNAFKKLKGKIPKGIIISYASEYMMENSLIEKANEKKLLCIKDNFVLVEMSYISAPINLFNIIYELQVNGYKVILAHPERYLFYFNKFSNYLQLKKRGCFFQANLLSATNYYSKNVSKKLDELLEKGMIDFVGSDIHSIRHINNFEKKVIIRNINLLKESINNNKKFS